VDDQRMFAAAYAERHGFELIAFDGDNGITGATIERPGLQAMLRQVTRG
jgi:site-specific DNA recombinase